MNKIGICELCRKKEILTIRTSKGWICDKCFDDFVEYEGVDND